MTPECEPRLSAVLADLEQAFKQEVGEGGQYPRSCAVLSRTGAVLAQRTTAPLLSFVLPDLASRLGDRGAEAALREGEVLVSNDPYLGSVSLNTIAVLVPIAGPAPASNGMLGFAVRYPDVGAMASSAFALKREITHEGFRLSLIRLVPQGSRLPEPLTAMLSANVRDPEKLIGGLRAQVATAREAAARLAADKGGAMSWGTQVLSAADKGPGATGLKQGRFHGVGYAASTSEEVSVPRVAAEVDIRGDTIVVNLSMVGEGLDANCNAPAGAVRAAVLTALGEACDAPPWAIAAGVTVDTGGVSRFDAKYPAAVGGGARVAFGCYRAVAAALTEAGATRVGGRSFHEFSGEGGD